jgi:hypothetical protein
LTNDRERLLAAAPSVFILTGSPALITTSRPRSPSPREQRAAIIEENILYHSRLELASRNVNHSPDPDFGTAAPDIDCAGLSNGQQLATS